MDVLPASTGVIGPSLPLAPIAAAMPALAAALSETGSSEAAEAIMTTDTVKKEFALTFRAGGKTCTLGGIAKGSGMIASSPPTPPSLPPCCMKRCSMRWGIPSTC